MVGPEWMDHDVRPVRRCRDRMNAVIGRRVVPVPAAEGTRRQSEAGACRTSRRGGVLARFMGARERMSMGKGDMGTCLTTREAAFALTGSATKAPACRRGSDEALGAALPAAGWATKCVHTERGW